MDTKKIKKDTKYKILEEILQSEEFCHSQKYQDLLRYLFNASINGEIVKESTIAVEFFSKDAVFDPSLDSSVRSYISNLRKKLEHYYLTEGKENDIKLILPKGYYHIEFSEKEKLKKIQLTKRKISPHFVYLPIVLVFIILAAFLGLDRLFPKKPINYISKNDPIWKELFYSDQKTLIVLGDYYFFSMPLDTDRLCYIRDIEINSENDLQAFVSSHSLFRNKISKTYHTYLEEHIPWCLSYILPSFIIHGKGTELKLASEVQLEDLKKYNIIYIGPYKCLYILQTITRNLDFQYSLRTSKSKLTFFHQDSNKVFTYSWITNPETKARNDYSVVAKVSGHNNNTFFFFISQHDFGNIAAVKYFTNPSCLKKFWNHVSSNYFEAIFEVTGIIRTDFTIKLIHTNPIYSDFYINLE